MLEELPEELDETYKRVLSETNKANRAQAHRLLQCLAVAIRPLRIAELAEVLADDFGTASDPGTPKLRTDWRWEDKEQAVLSMFEFYCCCERIWISSRTILSLLCQRIPDFSTTDRLEFGRLAFPYSSGACTHDHGKGLPGHSTTIG